MATDLGDSVPLAVYITDDNLLCNVRKSDVA